MDTTGTAEYHLSRDFIRFEMNRWGLCFTMPELRRAWKREKSIRRNDPDFLKPSGKKELAKGKQ